MARESGTGTSRRQRWLAVVAVCGVHALIGWGLLQVTRVPTSRTRASGTALQVVYLPAPRPAAVQRRTQRQPNATLRPAVSRAPSATKPPAAVMSAEFVHRTEPVTPVVPGDDRWASRTPGLAPDPPRFASKLTSRVATLPGRAGGRFKMQTPMSLADMVAAVGSHIAPEGYTQDPCPRNRDNITDLMDGRDPAALEQELAFERKHCRP